MRLVSGGHLQGILAACQTTSNPFQPCFASWEVDAAGRHAHGRQYVVEDDIVLNAHASVACQKENPGT